MSAKRKLLPSPCPKCGSKYGTVQMVSFVCKRKNGKSSGGTRGHVIRIGHYDSKGYDEAKKENGLVSNDNTEEENDRNLRSSQRRWCSFRSAELDEYYGLQIINKTATKPISLWLSNRVARVGWWTY